MQQHQAETANPDPEPRHSDARRSSIVVASIATAVVALTACGAPSPISTAQAERAPPQATAQQQPTTPEDAKIVGSTPPTPTSNPSPIATTNQQQTIAPDQPDVTPSVDPTPSTDAIIKTVLGDVAVTGDLALALTDAVAAEEVTWIEIRQGPGSLIASDDIVTINYVMYQTSTGELVEEATIEPLLVPLTLGFVPEALEQAIADHRVGARFVVAFPAEMPDLPGYFEPGAYTLVVDVISTQPR